jgi:ribosome assembly protein YihI (activator of Der GTPase)
VRTSVAGQSHAGNRAPRRERTEIDKSQRAHWKARKRTGDASPKRVNELIETGNALVTEAKGLGRGR